MDITVGARFYSFTDFKEKLDLYEKNELANFVIYKSALDKENPAMKYYSVTYMCKLFGNYKKTAGERNTKSYKQGCSAQIKIVQKKRNNIAGLEVTNIVSDHNHTRSKDLFVHMNKQRRDLIQKNEQHLENYFATKSNYAAIQSKLSKENTDGEIVTRRDLYNAKSKFEKIQRSHENDLVNLVQQLAKYNGTVTKIVTNENNEVDLIFFQDSRMKQYFASFPDLIMFDGTYNVNDRRMPLVVIMIVDGSGCSQIVAFILVKSENITTFENLFNIFKTENPKHNEVKVIISDKSFANRSIFRRAFPDAEHQFCIFHVLQIFEREITTKKRNITSEQKRVYSTYSVQWFILTVSRSMITYIND